MPISPRAFPLAPLTCLVLIVTGPGALHLRAAEPSPALAALAEAERSFARTSVEKGIRDSFLAFFADDGIAFRPHPVVYKEEVGRQPAPATRPPITLDWAPAWGDVAAAGDLGYTTGPYVITDQGPEKRPPQRGYYFSVWRKQGDGTWKVALDAGVAAEGAPEVRSATFQPGPRPAFQGVRGSAAGEPDPEAARTSLAEAERAFARDLVEMGAAAAYAARLDPAARMNRQGLVQLAGAEAIRAHLGKQEGKLTWQPPLASGIARSADLAYTYGRYERTKTGDKAMPERGYYVHVWRRAPGRDWKLVFDTESPLPPERG